MNEEKPRYNLSPNQATALRQIQRAPWTVETAQHKLQTTLGALYKRRFIAVTSDHRNRYISITEDGIAALQAQTHAEIERSRSCYLNPFAQVIRELANYDPTQPTRREVTVREKVVQLRKHHRAA